MQIAMAATISLGLFVVGHTAFAEDATSFAKIDVVYHSSTNTLDVTGIIYKTFSQNYALTIFDPQGRLIVVSQLKLSQDNAFLQSIIPSSALWSESGNYTVKLASGPEMLSEKSFYFSGISCCVSNFHGVQASLPKTTNVIDSPLKQFKSGIAAKDVTCKQGLQLIFKFEDSSPACVSKQTAQTLVERWWGMYVPAVTEQDIPILSNSIKVQNTNFTINYNISGSNKLVDANMDLPSKSLVLSLNTTGNGTLTVTLPRVMIDAKLPTGNDDKFYVLVNGQESIFKEINATVIDRTISIPFTNETRMIEIIGAQII